jgi:NAD(P)-dependent dehydrogenase (short-subunit alcohol dehydrogenase family)
VDRRHPDRAHGRPEDLSGLVGFLTSDASGYLASQTIVIDGGYTAV